MSSSIKESKSVESASPDPEKQAGAFESQDHVVKIGASCSCMGPAGCARAVCTLGRVAYRWCTTQGSPVLRQHKPALADPPPIPPAPSLFILRQTLNILDPDAPPSALDRTSFWGRSLALSAALERKRLVDGDWRPSSSSTPTLTRHLAFYPRFFPPPMVGGAGGAFGFIHIMVAPGVRDCAPAQLHPARLLRTINYAFSSRRRSSQDPTPYMPS
ncbi:hypothetical protein B0H16DRAFT_1896427 [Mycena metata]|uniref:Uncharacterized protein n=1 Tax=Mycena metata TaxID=1033252 RepID=A0AAD7ML18_9AGAR|nr:hypothetical protein B0H16DRAFT_1896427 [Mycena metata]